MAVINKPNAQAGNMDAVQALGQTHPAGTAQTSSTFKNSGHGGQATRVGDDAEVPFQKIDDGVDLPLADAAYAPALAAEQPLVIAQADTGAEGASGGLTGSPSPVGSGAGGAGTVGATGAGTEAIAAGASGISAGMLVTGAAAAAAAGLALSGGGSSETPDTTPPAVAITHAPVGTASIATGNLTYTFTFSEGVTDFTADDVVVEHGSKGTFTAVSSTVYTLAVTPDAGYEGNMTVSVAAGVATDAAGNPNTVAPPSVLAVDTLAPGETAAISSITDNLAPVTGVVASGGVSNDVTPTLAGTVSAQLGADEVVAIYRDGVRIGVATVSGTNWTYDDSSLVNGSTYSYTARVEDAVGNHGSTSVAYSMGIDTVAAAPSVPDLAAASDTGASGSDNITSVTTPTFTGTAEAGATVTLLEGSTVLGTAT
ncbi:MAG: hypothetical protein HGA47_11905, partial [Zoogloea sp.]|nr:hypothetical protein [Zoogloea sp.]